jgi:hypothetical protein
MMSNLFIFAYFVLVAFIFWHKGYNTACDEIAVAIKNEFGEKNKKNVYFGLKIGYNLFNGEKILTKSFNQL